MAHARRFRFGVTSRGATDARAWREQARKVEDLGYSTLFMPDHFSDTRFAPMVAIATVAGPFTVDLADSGLGQQFLNDHFRLLVCTLATMMLSNTPL